MTEFKPWASRTEIAAMLEPLVRRLTVLGPKEVVADIDDVLDELDYRDLVTKAQTEINIARGALEAEVRARIITLAQPDELCEKKTVKRSAAYGAAGYRTREEVITHRAKIRINGHPLCLTHGSDREQRHAVSREANRIEWERIERDELTDAEQIDAAWRGGSSRTPVVPSEPPGINTEMYGK